jgi:uroporphyrinogen-III decarboxylase
LQFGPVEKIEESVKNVVENCKEGGGFVLSGCNVIFKGIPAKHYQVMVDAHKKYGRLGNAKI